MKRNHGLFKVIVTLLTVMSVLAGAAACSSQDNGTTHRCTLTEDDWVEMVPATCKTEGTIGHYVCPVCGKCYNLAKKEVDDISIPTAGHSFGAWVDEIPATCISTGVPGYYRCTACWKLFDANGVEIPPEKMTLPITTHEYNWVEAVDATCTTDGCREHYHCDICGLDFDKDYNEIEATIPAHHIGATLQSLNTGTGAMTGSYMCSVCGESYSAAVSALTVGIPVLFIEGELAEMSKTNKVNITATYNSSSKTFTTPATLKWQGATSLAFPKKNFNIQFYDAEGEKYKVEMKDGWGEHSKYCLKANYIDFSQARNVVAGQIYSNMVHSRNKDDIMDSLANGGAVDGFPILIYINGSYQGLYTLNIPKDNWMFGMSEKHETREAALAAEGKTDHTTLRSRLTYDIDECGFTLEYCSTKDNPEIGTDWVVDSFNEMMVFVTDNDGSAFKAGIGDYIDIDRCIDGFLLTMMIEATDNLHKNIMWLTYDGKHWISSVYDMDGTFGITWAGKPEENYKMSPDEFLGNKLWKKLYKYYYDDIRARYKELREDIWADSTLEAMFNSFINSVPTAVYTAETTKWPSVPSLSMDCYDEITDWIEKRMIFLDKKFDID